MSDFTDSVKKIFEERISSPFYGSLIVSWLLWNWEIPYVTFIVDADNLGTVQKMVNGVLTNVYITNKIDYILLKCSNIHFLITFPLLSTAVILLLMPFITNGAYWITLKFDKWRVDKKNEVENTKLLSIEDSYKLRNQMFSQEERFSEIISAKDEEIEILKGQLKESLKEEESPTPTKPTKDSSKPLPSATSYTSDLSKFFSNPQVLYYYDKVYNSVRDSFKIPQDIPENVVKFCIAYQLIKRSGILYNITSKGELFMLELMKYQLEQKK